MDGDIDSDLAWKSHYADRQARRPFRDFSYSYVDGQGRRRYTVASGKPFFAPDGAFLGYRGVAADITERMQAEEALIENEERLAAILEASPIGVSIVGADGRRIYVNSRLAEMLGRSKEELIGGKTMSSYADPSIRDRLFAHYEKGEPVSNVEVELVRSDGSSIWTLVTFEPTAYRGEPARMTWIYDITERKRAEEEVARQKALLEATMENIDQGVIMYDDDLVVTACNRRKGLSL